jgi:hypothetical protein
MDEKLKILKMVEEGKISGEEAHKLLEALEAKPLEEEAKARWLKVKVIENGTQKVNVRIPLKLMKILAKAGGNINIKLPAEAQEQLAEKGIELGDMKDIAKLNDVIAELEKEAPFELVNVDEGDKKVYVIIE